MLYETRRAAGHRGAAAAAAKSLRACLFQLRARGRDLRRRVRVINIEQLRFVFFRFFFPPRGWLDDLRGLCAGAGIRSSPSGLISDFSSEGLCLVEPSTMKIISSQ